MSGTIREALWVLRAQCGDRDALEALLRHVEPALRRYVAGLVGASDADDVLQDVLVLIYRKLAGLSDPRLFRPWAFRIASRAGFRHLRRQRRWSDRAEVEVSVEEVAAAPVPIEEARVLQLLEEHRISPGCSAVLRLHFEEQMSLAEVGAVLDIPLGTVKSRLAYGLATLRKRLADRRN